MFDQIENSRVIVQRKVLLVLENDLKNRSDTLELLRMSLFANGWTEEGVFTCPLWKLAMKIWSVVMECFHVLIEERQRENSALGKRSASELDQRRRVNSCVEGVPGLATEGVIKTPAVLQEDAELRKAATAVLAGSAGILQAGSAASGCARVTKGVIENLKPPVSPTGGETCFSGLTHFIMAQTLRVRHVSRG
jgi:hypothetical protein